MPGSILSPVIPVVAPAGKPDRLLEVGLDLVNVLFLCVETDIYSHSFALKDGLDQPESVVDGVFNSHDCRRVACGAVWSCEASRLDEDNIYATEIDERNPSLTEYQKEIWEAAERRSVVRPWPA